MSWKFMQYQNGKIKTTDQGGGSSTLADLTDTTINNPANNQVLKYNSSSGKWVNSKDAISNLSDVTISTIKNGQILQYDSSSSKWKNVNPSSGTVTDVQVDGTSVVTDGVAAITTPDADSIDYDNTDSGLTATNIQDAIDELADSGGGGNVDDVEVNGTSVLDPQDKIAKITSYKEVTQAEYEALPASKTSDGVLYCIKDSNLDNFQGYPPLIYSDVEREVGVWRDGKPLYQKSFPFTINITTTSRTWWTIVSASDVTSIHMDTILIASESSYIVDCVDDTVYALPNSTYTAQAGATLGVSKTDSGAISLCLAALSTGNTSGVLTVRYTKTTDTPGSGTWNSQGAIAHHYSNTEQVIGTWIDGKPLYEIVTTGTTPSSTGYHGIATISGSMKVRSLQVYVDGTNTFIISGSLGFYAYGDYHENDFQINCQITDSGACNKPFTAIVQYTKTTD